MNPDLSAEMGLPKFWHHLKYQRHHYITGWAVQRVFSFDARHDPLYRITVELELTWHKWQTFNDSGSVPVGTIFSLAI